jgi:hypothetical protein
MFNFLQNTNNKLVVIKTARNIETINKAVKKGFWPLVKKVEPSGEIKSKFCVIQNKSTGEIIVASDFRVFPQHGWEQIIDFTNYYPYNFENPYAAYLIPKGLEIGQRVYIEDLIEDFISAKWNQGDVYRLEACEAIWNGKDLEIQYIPEVNRNDFIG